MIESTIEVKWLLSCNEPRITVVPLNFERSVFCFPQFPTKHFHLPGCSLTPDSFTGENGGLSVSWLMILMVKVERWILCCCMK